MEITPNARIPSATRTNRHSKLSGDLVSIIDVRVLPVFFDEGLGDRRGVRAAVAGVLHKHSDRDLGLFGRRVGYEPGVVTELLGNGLLVGAELGDPRGHCLGRPRLAGDRDGPGARPAAGTVQDYLPQRILQEMESVLLQRRGPAFHRWKLLEPPGRALTDGPDQPRPVERPSGGDGPDRDGDLERCEGDVTLPNGDGDGLADVPRLFPHALLPFGGGHDP